MRTREVFVQEAVAAMFLARGATVRTQVPLLGRIADIVCIEPGDDLVAVECKERNWGHAIHQAKTYQAAVNFAFVAVPLKAATARMLEVAEHEGIGVFAVHPSGVVEEVLPARTADHLMTSLQIRARERVSQSPGVSK